MASTKSGQFCAPLQPAIRKNEEEIFCLKIIESANTGLRSRPPTAPFRVDVINVWFLK